MLKLYLFYEFSCLAVVIIKLTTAKTNINSITIIVKTYFKKMSNNIFQTKKSQAFY